jgi:hypothetical protein
LGKSHSSLNKSLIHCWRRAMGGTFFSNNWKGWRPRDLASHLLLFWRRRR